MKRNRRSVNQSPSASTSIAPSGRRSRRRNEKTEDPGANQNEDNESNRSQDRDKTSTNENTSKVTEDNPSRKSVPGPSILKSDQHQGRKYEKKLSFHETFLEPTDSEFWEEYSKRIKCSWFALMFVMACLPSYCKETIRLGTTASDDIEITCLIPHLISKRHWNLTSIRHLTMPNRGRVCSYLDYNYSVFDNMDPKEAFEIKKQLKMPLVKSCTIKLGAGDHSFVNYTSTLLTSCISFDFKSESKRFRSLFEAISYIICGVLADIFGRKIIFLVCSIIYTIGIIMIPQADSYYNLAAGYSIEGIGITGMVLINYIIFVELCHANTRGLLMLYIKLFGTLAKVTGYFIKSQVYNFHETYYLLAIPSCSLLFYIYFVPESPRWLLSYGKKKRAWKILEHWGMDISQHTFLPVIKLNKFKILRDNFIILFSVDKYRRVIFLMTWFKLAKIVIIANLRRYVKIMNNNASSHKFLILMAEILSFFIVLPPFILFGRYLTLFCMLICGALCLIISLFIHANEGWYTLNILSGQYVYALDYVIVLYSAELIPTSTRGTGLGLILGLSEGLSVVAKFLMKALVLKKVMGPYECHSMAGLQIISIVLMIFLPNIRVGDLPDVKRYRKEGHT